MNNMSIEWHKDNLKNTTGYADRLEDEIKNMITVSIALINLDRITEDNKFRQYQIDEAEKENKKEFSDKYKITKWKNLNKIKGEL